MADTVTIVDVPAPAPPPAPTTAIPASALPGSATPADAPKPGSARERLFADLQKKAKPSGTPTEPPAKPVKSAEPAKPSTEQPTDPDPGDEPVEPATPPEPAKAGDKTTPDPEKKKASPWKVVDEYKARAAALEKENLELKKGTVSVKEKEELATRLADIQKRNEELEQEIRFHDYRKSSEFKAKYEQPYNAAWDKAMAELSEVPVTDPETGEQRAARAQDILNLVNLPLGAAKALAKKTFGDFTEEAMSHRKDIRDLFDAQNKALEEARTAGTEREKQIAEQRTAIQSQVESNVNEHWTKANEGLLADEKYGSLFKPVEGDENINQRLAKGFQLVDRALSENARDPRLTSEQRAAIVKRHAAVRMRAAAFGRLNYELNMARDKITALQAELSKYQGSEPTTSGGTITPSTPAPTSARESIFAELRRRAK